MRKARSTKTKRTELVYRERALVSKVTLAHLDKSGVFQACVRIGSRHAKPRVTGTPQLMRTSGSCGMGRTPRAAIAKALRTLALSMDNRSGHYKGLR